MKNKLFYLCSLITAFILGVVVTYLTMTKQQMDRLLQAKSNQQMVHTSNPDPNSSNSTQKTDTPSPVAPPSGKIEDKNTSTSVMDLNQLAENNSNVSVNDYSKSEAKQLVSNMPDYMLNQYVDKFMAKDASNVIADKRRFAERAIEELYNSNDNQPMVGTVKISLGPVMPEISIDTSKVDKFAKIYAHLDTNGQVPASPYVFIKWVNNQTGQVLLFDKKDVLADSNQNWVSFQPDDGWQVGSYDVRFYQFTSELQPIAQTTYNIYEVLE